MLLPKQTRPLESYLADCTESKVYQSHYVIFLGGTDVFQDDYNKYLDTKTPRHCDTLMY